MSRKNMLADIIASTAQEASQEENSEKLAMANSENSSEKRVLAGSVRTMGLALDRMENESKALHDALIAGEKVLELDPNLIEGSFIRDRLDNDLDENDELVQSILQNGQEVPILVRQHPNKPEHFQVAYGHRRLAALRLLNQKVRAVVRELTDEQLVVAQGVENTARKDLSYIEKALFAHGLESKGFTRDVIGRAVSLDKGELSKLISVAKRVPDELIRRIGAAPSAGRRRWQELADLLEDSNLLERAKLQTKDSKFHLLSTDDRFTTLLRNLTTRPRADETPLKSWRSEDKSASFSVARKAKRVSIELSNPNGLLFGDWLSDRLESLYDEFQRSKMEKNGE
ncbi:plasmid partitioning protein RepB [Brucella intermedia]|uniref:plasmid partitioning protein RepB n=1 Tax=Brucella intermedia TaxID=94625 RepID=UPI00209B061E|nr:plasmid partitioning protein RepB [Brucella intermedia]MCO7728859.1 plasmid partitioning protein RepB [Brucella intermedia]